MPVERDLQTNELHVVPGGRHVVVQTAGGHALPRLLVWDRAFDVVGRIDENIADVGVSPDGERMLRLGIQAREMRTLPALAPLAALPEPADPAENLAFLSLWGVDAAPGGTRWAAVVWGQVTRIDENPLRIAATAHPALDRTVATSIDDATGLLVMTDGRNRLEAFDLETMRTVFVAELPCREAAYDVVAHGGTAWIATHDGSGDFLEFDLRTRTAVRHSLGLEGIVSLAGSLDGSHVAAVVLRPNGRDRMPTLLMKVYTIAEEGLVEDASLQCDAPTTPFDVAIVPEWGIVLIAGYPTLAWHLHRRRLDDAVRKRSVERRPRGARSRSASVSASGARRSGRPLRGRPAR